MNKSGAEGDLVFNLIQTSLFNLVPGSSFSASLGLWKKDPNSSNDQGRQRRETLGTRLLSGFLSEMPPIVSIKKVLQGETTTSLA